MGLGRIANTPTPPTTGGVARKEVSRNDASFLFSFLYTEASREALGIAKQYCSVPVLASLVRPAYLTTSRHEAGEMW